MSRLRSGSFSSVPRRRGPDRRDRNLLTLEEALPVERLQMLHVHEALRVNRVLDQAAVGIHRRLVDAFEAARLVDLSREEREVLGQVRQVHAGELLLRLGRATT